MDQLNRPVVNKMVDINTEPESPKLDIPVDYPIPERWRCLPFRYLIIEKNGKAAIEKGWNTTANYSWNDGDLVEHITVDGGNYGPVCGFGNLVVVDQDIDGVSFDLPDTFTTKTGKGHHYYYTLDGELPKATIELSLDDNHLGEVRWKGAYVVGPGSTHPNGSKYTVERDNPIANITAEELLLSLCEYIDNTEREKVVAEGQQEARGQGIDLSVLRIEDIIPHTSFRAVKDGWQGAHPIHGSSNGFNLYISILKQAWHCFRHGTGGGPLHWIALETGILRCEEVRPGALSGKKFIEAVEAARHRGLLPAAPPAGPVKDATHAELASRLLANHHIITYADSEESYIYDDKQGLYIPAVTRVKALVEQTRPESTKRYVEEVMAHIQRRTYHKREPPNPNIIHVRNGILDLTTGQLQPFTPDIVSVTGIPVEFRPEQDCPLFKKFLTEVLYPEDHLFVQEFVGYTLYRGYPFAKALMPVGGGANGKSTFIKVLIAILGRHNVSNVKLQDLDGNRFTSARLDGMLANFYDDLPDNALKHTGTFKSLTGGAPVSVENKYGKPYDMINTAKFIFACNKLPRTFDDSDAFFRRLHPLVFPRQFIGTADDPNLIEKMTTPEELSGLLNWALDGLKRLLSQGWSSSRSIDEVRELYERMADPLYAFVKDSLVIDVHGFIEKDVLYRRYVEYCNAQKLPPLSKGVVTREITRHLSSIHEEYHRTGKGRVRGWAGVRFKTEADANSEDNEVTVDSFGEHLSTSDAPPEVSMPSLGASDDEGAPTESPTPILARTCPTCGEITTSELFLTGLSCPSCGTLWPTEDGASEDKEEGDK